MGERVTRGAAAVFECVDLWPNRADKQCVGVKSISFILHSFMPVCCSAADAVSDVSPKTPNTAIIVDTPHELCAESVV